MHFLVAGGGIAGLCAGIALKKRQPKTAVTILEPDAPFHWSSGRNAAIARSHETDAELTFFCKKTLLYYHDLERRHPGILRPVGLHIDPYEHDYSYRDFPEAASLAPREGSVTVNGRKLPTLFLPGDGIVSLTALRDHLCAEFLSAGGEIIRDRLRLIRSEEEADALDAASQALSLPARDVHVLLAAGSFSGQLPPEGSANRFPLRSYKRHLFTVSLGEEISSILWLENSDLYVRPGEKPGTALATLCDEKPSADYEVVPAEAEKFRRRFAEYFPRAEVIEERACLRSFVLDQRPLVGWDPHWKNLFWFTGLGGRGISLTPALAELLPDLVENGWQKKESERENPFTLHRF